MRKRFSERYGFKKPRDAFQIESMDEGLRNRLWNQFRKYYIDRVDLEYVSLKLNNSEKDYKFFQKIYDEFFKISNEVRKNIDLLADNFRKFFIEEPWFYVYDFIEFIANKYWDNSINKKFKEAINKVLEEEMSVYRFVGDYIAPIIDKVEIKEIEDVFESKYEPVKRHLSNALELLSDRENPDYINSIKESITALEALTQIITGKKTDLGNCLKELKKQNILDLNNEFVNGLIKLYSWTNKEDGIRHAHTDEELKTSFEEAKYMLVSSSAFINYLIAKYEQGK